MLLKSSIYVSLRAFFFYSTGSTLNKAFRSLSFLLFFFFQNASPHSPSQLNEKHCWPLIFHGSITIFNFVDKCAIVKPSKVSPTLGLCVLLYVCVCSCMHTVFVCPRFGFFVKGEIICLYNGSWLFAEGSFMLQLYYSHSINVLTCDFTYNVLAATFVICTNNEVWTYCGYTLMWLNCHLIL